MRLAFIVRSVPPAVDGVGEYTLPLVAALREGGVDARIFTEAATEPPAGAPSWVIPAITRWTGADVSAAVAGAAGFRPDWCCFQYVPQMYGRRGVCWSAAGVPAALRRRLGCRVAVTFHEFISAWRPRLRALAAAIMSRAQTRRLLAGCDAAIVTCRRYAGDLAANGGSAVPIHEIPVGATIEPAGQSGQAIEERRRRWGLGGAAVLGVFGRVTPWRNHAAAIRVLAAARRAGRPARLLMIGRMECSNPRLFAALMAEARRLGVEADVVVTGELPAAEVSAHLSLVDVFLFPQSDGLSTRNSTLMVALAHGLPVVAYAPVRGNFDGFAVPFGATVPAGDEPAFTAAALRLADGRGRDAEGRRANRAYFERHFAWPVLASRYLAVLT